MRVVLKLADPALNENPAVREWLDKMAAVLNTPEMIEERVVAALDHLIDQRDNAARDSTLD